MDRKLTLNITRQIAEVPQFRLLTVRYARDPQIIDLLAPEPARQGDTGNFSHLTYYSENGGFGDVHNTVNLGNIGGEWEQYILAINPNAIKNNLINPDFDETGKAKKVYWYTGGDIVFGNMVAGSTANSKNTVRVKTNADGSLKLTRKLVKFPNWDTGVFRDADFVEVDGFRKADKGRPVSELLADGKIGYFSQISSSWVVSRSLGQSANVLCPYWDGDDFPAKYGRSYLPLAYFEGYGLTV